MILPGIYVTGRDQITITPVGVLTILVILYICLLLFNIGLRVYIKHYKNSTRGYLPSSLNPIYLMKDCEDILKGYIFNE